MHYAIIKTGSKQYQAIAGKTLKVEKLDIAEGAVVFDQVLLHVDGDKVELGAPVLSGIKVFGTAMGTLKADKIQVFKYKSKSRYRKLRGHRQPYTLVKIESIGSEPAKVVKAVKEVKKVEKAVKVEKIKALHIESSKTTREMSPDAKQSGRPTKKPVAKKLSK